VKRLAVALDTEGGVRMLWWLIGGSLVVGFAVFLLVGANQPKYPELEPRQSAPGFGTITFAVKHGAVTDEFCALLAGNDQQRETGMTGRHDLGGYDAMVFAWPQPVNKDRVAFFNRKVPIALSVAWFDADGKFLSNADMEPCGDVPNCPAVKAAGNYKFAIEVPKGGLGRLGIGKNAVFTAKSSGC
jgi:uncharacterized membrane protein (UPF0127 family)